MKEYIKFPAICFSLFIFHCSFFTVSAQDTAFAPTYANKKLLMGKIDALIYSYQDACKFDDVEGDSISPKAVANFRRIFTTDATVYDDMSPPLFDLFYKEIHKIPVRKTEDSASVRAFKDYFDNGTVNLNDGSIPILAYISRIKKTYPAGFSKSKIDAYKVNYNRFEAGVCYVVLHREVENFTRDGYWINCSDTLLLTIQYSGNLKLVKISSLRVQGAVNFRILNDGDHDGVVDDKDKCQGIKGSFKFNGCLPPVAPLLSLTFTGGPTYASTKFTNPGGELFNINNSGVNFKQTGSFALNDYYLSAEVELFILHDKKTGDRKLGFSIGATIFGNKTALSYSNYSWDGQDPAGQTINNGKETENVPFFRYLNNGSGTDNVSCNFLLIPVMAKYKINLDPKKKNKFSLKISAGVSYSVLLQASSAYNTTFQYGAIYPSMGNLNVTNQFVQNHDGNSNANTANYFNTLQKDGLDVMYNGNASGSENISNFNQSYVSFIFKPTLSYHLNKATYLDLGIMYIHDRRSNNVNVDNYILTDYHHNTNSGNPFSNPLVQGFGTMNTDVFSLYFGITFGIFNGYGKDVY